MKRTILVVSALLMAACAGRPAAKPGSPAAGLTIAVLPFQNNTGDASLNAAGAAMADVVATRLVGLRGIKLVERQRLAQIAAESRLAMAGLTDEATAAQVGKLAGADALALGSYSGSGERFIVSLRVVKAQTGEILASATEQGSGVSHLEKFAESAAKSVAAALTSR